MARRLDCAHLAELVAQHRLSIDEAAATARYLIVDQPRDVFGI